MRLLSAVVLATAALQLNAQRSQFEVDCPRVCRCNKTSIECIAAHAQRSNIFLRMRPEAYPDLDTLVVTGASLGDLTASNLFGERVTHRILSLVNLSDNAISAFDSATFEGLTAVEYFYLNGNALTTVGEDPFRWNKRLRVLDISNIFARSVTLAERSKILWRMFAKSSNEFINLQEIIIRGNSLVSLQPETFCKLQGLIRLHLTDNKLTSFAFNDGCLPSLKVLDLSQNQLVTVPMRLWDGLPVLNTIDISSNPLRCDCALAPFIERLSESASSSLNQGRTTCASPASRKGHNVFDVEDFGCSSHHRILIFTLILLVLSAAFILTRAYLGHVKFIHLPFVAGYSKLSENEGTGPQFV
uniref:Protein slit n=1 Tax=Ascaris suum TaxID=6253 RepID=F1KZE0_ASCSU